MSDPSVGIVVVSHSRALGNAAAELAGEVIGDVDVPITVAAGLDDTTPGTDAAAIATAIATSDRGAGVVVLMDLGSALAYWIQADDDRLLGLLRRQPTHLPGMLTRAEIVRLYAERSGRTVEDFTFYEVFGLFRLAVIVQQIYYRYHHKQTRNPAFRHFWIAVNYLDRRCRRLIRS